MSDAYQKLKELTAQKNATNLVLGEYLAEIKDSDEYLKYADTWKAFLEDPEIKINQSTANRYAAIYRKYIKELGIEYERLYGLDTGMLYYVAKKVNRDNVEDWLDKVGALSRSDIIREVTHPDVDVMSCVHDFKPFKEKCVSCGEIQSCKLPKTEK